MKRVLRATGVLLAGGLLLASLAACGSGGDNPDAAFCDKLIVVRTRGAELPKVKVDSDSDLPEAKAAILRFVKAFDDALAAAPDAIKNEADATRESTAAVTKRVEAATTIMQLKTELPPLIRLISQELDSQGRVSGPIIDYAIEHCPDLT